MAWNGDGTPCQPARVNREEKLITLSSGEIDLTRKTFRRMAIKMSSANG